MVQSCYLRQQLGLISFLWWELCKCAHSTKSETKQCLTLGWCNWRIVILPSILQPISSVNISTESWWKNLSTSPFPPPARRLQQRGGWIGEDSVVNIWEVQVEMKSYLLEMRETTPSHEKRIELFTARMCKQKHNEMLHTDRAFNPSKINSNFLPALQ